jgi:hypothetical protein
MSASVLLLGRHKDILGDSRVSLWPIFTFPAPVIFCLPSLGQLPWKWPGSSELQNSDCLSAWLGAIGSLEFPGARFVGPGS